MIFAGCKKSEQNSKLDAETQESFKRLGELSKIVDQIEKDKQKFVSNTNDVIFSSNIVYSFSKIGVTNFLRINNTHPVYQLVDKRELNSYLMGLKKFYFDNNVLNWYSNGAFDCGDYAFGANWYAKAWHRNSKTRISGTSIAVGTVFYLQTQTGIYHAINAIILKDRSILFIEPQDQSEIALSRAEIQSINYIQF